MASKNQMKVNQLIMSLPFGLLSIVNAIAPLSENVLKVGISKTDAVTFM